MKKSFITPGPDVGKTYSSHEFLKPKLCLFILFEKIKLAKNY